MQPAMEKRDTIKSSVPREEDRFKMLHLSNSALIDLFQPFSSWFVKWLTDSLSSGYTK